MSLHCHLSIRVEKKAIFSRWYRSMPIGPFSSLAILSTNILVNEHSSARVSIHKNAYYCNKSSSRFAMVLIILWPCELWFEIHGLCLYHLRRRCCIGISYVYSKIIIISLAIQKCAAWPSTWITHNVPPIKSFLGHIWANSSRRIWHY